MVPFPASGDARPAVDGKFLRVAGARFWAKGVAYGTFAPDEHGVQYPTAQQRRRDFELIRSIGANTIRVYTPPPRELLDEAAEHGLRVMVGLPWVQHVSFLDQPRLAREIRRELVRTIRTLANHPAVLLFALGNEIPPAIVRWHGGARIERFLHEIYREAKSAAPSSLFTYVNFPPTEYLELPFLDVVAFNVYLHDAARLRAYLARLQQQAGGRPLLLAEAGACSRQHGPEGQAALASAQVRAAFTEGACGAIVFGWTDDWWRGGHQVTDWAFGLVDRERAPKPSAAAVADAFAAAPFAADERSAWPEVSVIVCARNAAATLDDCLCALERLHYPRYEILVVNDGSTDETGAIARHHSRVRVIDIPPSGLSTARNAGLAEAAGEIVAYTDADARPDEDWLAFLVRPFLRTAAVAAGGPNVVPPDDPGIAQCVARAPGAPTHVMLDDCTAEHIPGVNMAFRRDALIAIGGFNPVFVRAGDDVDVCWRLMDRGGTIGFAPAALVWHHHRRSVRAYWRQQVGYGESERWLSALHPQRFRMGRVAWHGSIYAPLVPRHPLSRTRVNAGIWGTAAFPSVYRTAAPALAYAPLTSTWIVLTVGAVLAALALALSTGHPSAVFIGAAGAMASTLTAALAVVHAAGADLRDVRVHPLAARALIAALHVIQPLARSAGQLRGRLYPAHPTTVPVRAAPPAWPIAREPRRALLLVTGNIVRDDYWGERAVSTEQILDALVARLRRTRETFKGEAADGWTSDRDVSVRAGWWAWLDLRAVVEDHSMHERPRSLLRVAARLRLSGPGALAAVALAAISIAAAAIASSTWVAVSTSMLSVAVTTWAFSRAMRAAAFARTQMDDIAAAAGLMAVRRRGAALVAGPTGAPLRDRLPAERP